MKIITISDLHGRDSWRQIDLAAYDKVIFLGDYTDSYELSDSVIFSNLQQITDLKSRYPEKVVLLIGNHDAQYVHYPLYRCSGFRVSMQLALTGLFAEHKSFFQIAHQEGAYLFTHAGVTNTWLNHLRQTNGPSKLGLDLQDMSQLANALNQLHEHRFFRHILFEVGVLRGGWDPAGGPVWADKRESSVDFLHGLHQVVGHTPVPDFLTVGDADGSITYTDVLQTRPDFYVLEIAPIE